MSDTNTGEISHSPQGFSGLIYNTVWGTLAIQWG